MELLYSQDQLSLFCQAWLSSTNSTGISSHQKCFCLRIRQRPAYPDLRKEEESAIGDLNSREF